MLTPVSTHPSRLSLVVLLALLAAPTLLLWRVVFLGDVFLPAALLHDVLPWRDAAHLVPWNPIMWDGMAEFYPWRLFAARTLHQGFLPLWNPYQFCGTPFLANGQSAILYPLNLLFVLLPVTRAFGASVWLHLVLTGLFMYGFLRSGAVQASRIGALVGGVIWQLSTWQMGWLALPTFLCVSAWLPLTLWLTYRLVMRPSAARATALGLVLGLTILAGHLQIALYGFLLTSAYGLFLLTRAVRIDKQPWQPILGGFALALIVVAGTSAPQMLPTLELSRVSHRAGAIASWASYQAYVRLALPLPNLVTLYLPGVFGNPTEGTFWGIDTNGGPSAYVENGCSIGILGLLLAMVGVVAGWRQRAPVCFFSVAAVLAILLALGTLLNALLYFGLPGFAQSGSPARILELWTFCAAVLAAVGVDALPALARRQGFAALGVFVLGLLLSAAYAVVWIGQNAAGGTLAAGLARVPDWWRLPLGILLGAGAFGALWRRGTWSARVFQAGMAALILVELLAANGSYNRTCRASDVYPATPLTKFLQSHAGGARIMPINRAWGLSEPPQAVLPPNSGMVYNLRDLQGYDSLLTGRFMAWAATLDGGSPAPPENGNMVFTYGVGATQARSAGAAWIVTQQPLAPNPNLPLVYQGTDGFVYHDTHALPRAQAEETTQIAYVAEEAPTRRLIGLEGGNSAKVTLADQWYPGWWSQTDHALLDVIMGENTMPWHRVERTKDMFQSIRIDGPMDTPPRIETCYRPASFQAGLYALCLTLAWSAGLLGRRGFAWARQRRAQGPR